MTEQPANMRFTTGYLSIWTEMISGFSLRNYQLAPALAILKSVREKSGNTYVVIFPRQSGKNEVQAMSPKEQALRPFNSPPKD